MLFEAACGKRKSNLCFSEELIKQNIYRHGGVLSSSYGLTRLARFLKTLSCTLEQVKCVAWTMAKEG